MQNMKLKTVACALIALMMAVLLGGHPTNPAAVGQTVDLAEEVNFNAEPGRSPWVWSRHSLKRHERRLILINRRQRRRVRRALNRAIPLLIKEERRKARSVAIRRFVSAPFVALAEWRDARIEPQCAVCGVHQNDGFAVDTTLRPAQCIDCFTESEGLRAYAPLLCAAVVGLIFATFAPQWSGLALIGATRQPMPQWAKDGAKKHGVKIRRHESGRKTIACAGCMNGIESGDIKAMLPASGYSQNKPHCEACAKVRLTAADVPAVPQTPTPEPTPEPTPAPTVPTSTRPPNRKAGQCAVCGTDVAAGAGHIHTESPRGQKVRCSAHAETPHGTPSSDEPAAIPAAEGVPAQIAALLAQAMSSGAVDEAAVRRIVDEETRAFKDGMTAAQTSIFQHIEKATDEAKTEALEAVEQRLKEINAPVILHIKTDDGPAVPAADEGEIIHRQEREILAKISALSKRNRAQNIMLVGDPGTGKTYMSEGIFKRLLKIGFFKGMEKQAVCHVESCNEEKQPSDLMGRLSPAFFDDGSGTPSGAWRFFAGAVMKSFCSPGILVFDEIDTLAPPSFSALNAMLANGFIIDPDGVRHYRHPRCVVIATANTRGNGANEDFTASHAQSLASLDRFAAGFVDVDFDPAIEDALAPTIADDVRALRILSKERRARRVVFSYRVMMNAESLAQDFGKDYALSETVFQFGAENAALLGFDERVPLPDDADMSGLAPMPAKARKAAEKVRSASFSLQSFNADINTNTDTGGAA